MRKRKKFDRGGSVMDKPNQDMRDPAYRKSLERKQALEESPLSPEDLVVGPAKRVYEAGKLLYGARRAVKSAPDIGTNVSRMVGSSKDDLAKKLGVGAKESSESTAKQVKAIKEAKTERLAEQIEKEGEARFKGKLERQARTRQQQKAAGREGLEAAGKYNIVPMSYGTLGNIAMEAEDKASGALQRAREGKKAGGVIKSASKRGDGIAQRGKTKGRMV